MAGLLALSVPLFAQLPPPPPPPPSPVIAGAMAKGSGFILGRVVDAASGQPVAEATVTLVQLGGGRGGGPAVPGLVAPLDNRVVTGVDGRFLFHDLPAGSFPINVMASGYLQGSAGQARAAGPSVPVALADGQRLTDLTIRLWKHAVVSGTIVDENGEPAVNVMVRAYSRTMQGGRPRFSSSGSARTDDRGVYRIHSLVPGDYVVGLPQTQLTMPASIMNSVMQGVVNGGGGVGAVSMMDLMASGGPPPAIFGGGGVRIGDYTLSTESGSTPAPAKDGRLYVYPTVFYASAQTAMQATSMTLKSAEERSGVDFQLRLTSTARVSGSVTGPSGPMGAVGVRLVPAGDAGGGDAGVDIAATATKSDGTFTMLGVPEGQFIARVVKQPRPELPPEIASSPMMQMVFGNQGPATGDAAKLLYADVPVTVSGVDVAGVSIALHEGVRVSGRLEFDGSAPRPAGPAVQTMMVLLSPADGRQNVASGGGRPQNVSADFQFKTSLSPAGKYFFTVFGRGSIWFVRSATVGGRDVLTQPIELKDADITDVVITFTDRPSQISGSVRSDTAVATAGTMVMLFPQDYQTWIANGMASSRAQTVRIGNSTGAYTLQGLLPGDYLIAALVEPGDSQDPAFIEAVSRVATHVTIAEAEKKTLDLKTVAVRR